MKKILVITDNGLLFERFVDMIDTNFPHYKSLFDYRKSHISKIEKKYETGIEDLEEINVKGNVDKIVENYFLVISMHCKQIFPGELIRSVRCVNVHPGYNPANRGWYPQVFALLNNTVVGATIHEMDEFLDHGMIICRETVSIYPTDTSKEIYDRIIIKEIELLMRYLPHIINNDYLPIKPEKEGIVHTRSEFKNLCQLNLGENLTMGEAIIRLRALTHGSYANAFYWSEKGEKIYVKISLSTE